MQLVASYPRPAAHPALRDECTMVQVMVQGTKQTKDPQQGRQPRTQSAQAAKAAGRVGLAPGGNNDFGANGSTIHPRWAATTIPARPERRACPANAAANKMPTTSTLRRNITSDAAGNIGGARVGSKPGALPELAAVTQQRRRRRGQHTPRRPGAAQIATSASQVVLVRDGQVGHVVGDDRVKELVHCLVD